MATRSSTKPRSTISVKTRNPRLNLRKNATSLFNLAKNNRPKSYNSILVILVVIAAFLIGVLFTKVQYLEKNQAVNVTAGAEIPAAAGSQPQTGAKVDLGVGHFPPIGDKNAKVKIIEFADFRCPFCERFYKESENQIIENYVKTGKAVLYFRHFAFLGPASIVAANATECANEQGKFWEMHNYLFDNQPPETDTSMYTVDKLTGVAGTLGMDSNKFSSCLTANTYQKNVDKDQAEGQTAGVSGTPTMFINGIPIVGAVPYSEIKTQIDQELSK